MSTVLSTVTVTTVGLICKAVINSGFCSITVNGLPTLIRALEDDRRSGGQGVVTGSYAHQIQNSPPPLADGAIS